MEFFKNKGYKVSFINKVLKLVDSPFLLKLGVFLFRGVGSLVGKHGCHPCKIKGSIPFITAKSNVIIFVKWN